MFDLNKYTSNRSKWCVFKVDFGYPKELRELHKDFVLVPDKIELEKKKMLFQYQLKIVNSYNIPIGNNKNLVPNFLIRKNMCLNENLQLYVRLGLKLTKIDCVLEFN